MKVGIVVEGGGMRGAYSSGVLDSFLEKGIEFDYCIGVSSGSANLASFMAKQPKRNMRFYSQYAFDKRFLSLDSYNKTGNLFGLDFIYSTLTNSTGIDPLDYPTLKKNKATYIMVATDALTGDPHYFTKEDLSQDEYSPIKASSCLPGFCHPVTIQGREYFDGGCSDAVPVKKAIEDGCDKVVVILSKKRDYMEKQDIVGNLYPIVLKKYPKLIQTIDEMPNRDLETKAYLEALEREGKAYVIAPKKEYGVSTNTLNRANLEKLYAAGYEDGLEYIASLPPKKKSLWRK